MCITDCIKKHLWRIIAIFFMFTTLALGLGWGLTDPCDTPDDGSNGYGNPKIISGTQGN